MGIGVVFGGVQSGFDFAGKLSANPYVLAFHITTVLIIVSLFFGILFLGGAKFLNRHFYNNEKKIWKIKLTVAGLLMLFTFAFGNFYLREFALLFE